MFHRVAPSINCKSTILSILHRMIVIPLTFKPNPHKPLHVLMTNIINSWVSYTRHHKQLTGGANNKRWAPTLDSKIKCKSSGVEKWGEGRIRLVSRWNYVITKGAPESVTNIYKQINMCFGQCIPTLRLVSRLLGLFRQGYGMNWPKTTAYLTAERGADGTENSR